MNNNIISIFKKCTKKYAIKNRFEVIWRIEASEHGFVIEMR